jgi:hypothetical protein
MYRMKIVDFMLELALRIAIIVIGVGLALVPDPIPLADEVVITIGTSLIQLGMESDLPILDEIRKSIVGELPSPIRTQLT